MPASPFVIRPADGAAGTARSADPAPSVAWSLLSWVGAAFLTIGLLDLALGWYPARFGNAEWEFGTIARTLDSLPITILGLALALAGAAARGATWAARGAAAGAILLAVTLLAALAVFALDVPLAFRVVADPLARAGLQRAVAKALVQGTLYPTVLVAIGVAGIRVTTPARPRLS
jgi:hypothetical protein